VKTWYASVNYGLELAVSEVLRKNGAKNISVIDSAVIYKHPNKIDVRCINNLFVVLAQFTSADINDAAKKVVTKQLHIPKLNGKTFRVVVMDCGKLRPLAPASMNEIERIITRQSRAATNRANPDIEFWLNRRNDNTVYFMQRVKKHPSFNKTLKKGELRPDIVDVMIRTAEIRKDSIIVDPFGGWGAVAAAITGHWQYRKIYTGDINKEMVGFQQERLHKAFNCMVQLWDVKQLPLADSSVDAIITDPPWGEYEAVDVVQLYDGFMKESTRILRQDGALVFLSSQGDAAMQALDRLGFSFSSTILKIGGREAFLFECRK